MGVSLRRQTTRPYGYLSTEELRRFLERREIAAASGEVSNEFRSVRTLEGNL